jgi:hypothetical protein
VMRRLRIRREAARDSEMKSPTIPR